MIETRVRQLVPVWLRVFLWSFEMAEEPNTETAFPAMTPGGYCTPGMTLRDWFAGQALAALIASEVNESAHGDSEDAYMYADAMLLAREPKPDTTTAQHIALGIGGGK
jgi:hypothetical protein